MGSTKRSRPSPAVIVAALGLVVGLASTALAAPEVVTKPVTNQQVKKIAKKQAKKQVSKLALGNQVVTHVESITIPDGAADGAVATCAPGEVLIGGGVTPVGSGEGELGTVVASGPIDPLQPLFGVPTDGSKLDAWGGFFRNDEGTLGGGAGAPATLNVFAVCSR